MNDSDDELSTDDSSESSRIRFSLRSLFLATAILAVLLTIAVRIPILFVVIIISLAIGGFLQGISRGASYATSEKRPLLATIAWIAFGAFFIGLARVLVVGFEGTFPVFVLICFLACAGICLFRAWHALLVVVRKND
jgi:hypothetical protein